MTTREDALIEKCERLAMAVIDTADRITKAIAGAESPGAGRNAAFIEALAGKARVDAIRAELISVVRADGGRRAALHEAACVVESMVVGGRAWTEAQAATGEALFTAAKTIRAMGDTP